MGRILQLHQWRDKDWSLIFGYPVMITYLFLVGLIALIVALSMGGSEHEHPPLALLMVASAGFSLGGVLGFLYAPFKGEQFTISDLGKAFPIGAGGILAWDVFKLNDSLVHRFLANMALFLGLPHGEGLVLVVIVTFAPLGFLNLFVYKRLRLNRSIWLSDAEQAEDARKALESSAASLVAQADGEATVFSDLPISFSNSVKSAAEALIKSWESLGNKTPDDYSAYAKALCAVENASKGVEVLDQAILEFGDNVTLKMTKAMILMFYDKPRGEEVIELLLGVCRDPSPRSIAFKLLGYAYLKRIVDDMAPSMKAENAESSIKFSEEYRRMRLIVGQYDPGVEYNLAAAYGVKALVLAPTIDATNPEQEQELKALKEKVCEHLTNCKNWLNKTPKMQTLGFAASVGSEGQKKSYFSAVWDEAAFKALLS